MMPGLVGGKIARRFVSVPSVCSKTSGSVTGWNNR